MASALLLSVLTFGQADRGLLMQSLQGTYPGWLLDGNKLAVSGWVDGSFTASSARHDNLPLGFDYRANEPLLQQAWLRVERAVDPKANGPTFGFRSDTLVGSDYRFTAARGLFDAQLRQNGGEPNTVGLDPVQFYGETYLPGVGRGLDVKAGRFFAQFGVESIDTTQNALASHSYTFIYDPFTHTGLLGTLKLDDAWSVQGGLVAGSDVFLDPASRPTFVGGFKWAPPSGRDSVLVSVVVGPGRYEPRESFNNPQVFDLVYTHKFSDRLNYSLDALFGYQTGVPDLGSVTWFAAVNYLTYQIGPRLGGTARVEFFDDVDGQRTGFRGLYTALTAGLQFKPHPSILIRPELRYDVNDTTHPFEGRRDLFTASLDVVFRF